MDLKVRKYGRKKYRMTKIRCNKCEVIHRIYRIKEKWIVICDCKNKLIWAGQIASAEIIEEFES